eukprot:3844082-Lingulodinium_polyedra.AAC.1
MARAIYFVAAPYHTPRRRRARGKGANAALAFYADPVAGGYPEPGDGQRWVFAVSGEFGTVGF